MKIKSLMLMTNLLPLLNPFTLSSYAVTSASGLPDEMTLEVFSFLTPSQLGNRLEVSREFHRLACDKNSPVGKLNKNHKGKDLYTFCRKMEFDFGEVEALAHKVAAMTANPVPNLVSKKEFKEAKHHAQQIVDGNF
ncbi:hypothetical protein IM40_03020 [Candidatus Paracaedimonas acanthamoebae]|nr:hypothetical protein IM40_03020 [Candidatus Paracaedimonas acanthamoebae]